MCSAHRNDEPTPPGVVGGDPEFARNVMKLGGGAAISQIFALAAAPILTRLFAPEAFGTAAVFASVVAIFSVIACLRYDLAIVLPKSDPDAARLLGGSLGIATVISLAGFPLVAWGGHDLSAWLNTPDLVRFRYWIPVAVFTGGLFLAYTAWAIRRKWFADLSVARVGQSAAATVTQLIFGAVGGFGAAGLVFGAVFGSVVSALYLAVRSIGRDGRLFREVGVHGFSPVLRRYRKFPQYSTGSALLNTVSWQVPAFLLAVFFSPAVVGFYALGSRVLRGPMTVLGNSLSQVFFREAAGAAREGTLSTLVEGVFRRLVRFGLFPILTLAIVGDILFAWVFGGEWREAGVYVQILSVWSFFRLTSSPLSTLFSVLERQEFGLALNAVNLVTRVGSIVAGGVAGDARLALALFSASGVLTYGALGVASMQASGVPRRRLAGIVIGDFLRFLPAGALLVFLRGSGVADGVTLSIWGACLVAFAVVLVRRDPALWRTVTRAVRPSRTKAL